MDTAHARSSGTIDPITLAVVSGALETAQREMTRTMERTGRSSVLTVSRDFSNAIFNWTPEMIVQGQDLPIHLGSLILATRAVVEHFKGNIRPGDIIIHNDPTYDGSHLPDWCQYAPVFFEEDLVFWLVSKAHMADGGGPVPGSYNPEAKEIFAEGLRIPPIKIFQEGREQSDLLNLLLLNVRTRRNIAGDLRAQLAALRIGERSLQALLKKYGRHDVKRCVSALLDLSEAQMRQRIRELPDGIHEGGAFIEDIGHGLGDKEVRVEIQVQDDRMRIRLSAPPQLPYYTNSYRANATSAVYLGLVMFMQPEAPYNAGMYRPIEIDYGPRGTMVNAVEPAPHVASTTCPAETLTDAVRNVLNAAYPTRAAAGWGHCSCINVSGVDPRTASEYVHMMVSMLACGAGAVSGIDGWHCVGPQAGLGGATCGEQELLEYHYPLIVHSYSLRPDSGGAGTWRGGSGVICEIEPVGHTMTAVVWGEGRKYPASGARGATSPYVHAKVGRVELIGANGEIEHLPRNTVLQVSPGQRLRTYSAGGGGVGPSEERDPLAVRRDVVDGLVTVEAARTEYKVVIDGTTLDVDAAATDRLRGERLHAASSRN